MVCTDHDHELLKPQLISTWMPNGVGAMPGRRMVFAETQVSFVHLILTKNNCTKLKFN